MRGSDRRLWPFEPRTSIYASVTVFVALLLVVAWLRVVLGWPSEGSEHIVLVGVPLVSLLPIALLFLDNMMQRGGVIEFQGAKLDFTQMRAVGTSGVTVPGNIGVRGEMLSHSGTVEILESLERATTSDVVVIDLEEGQAWWETRLLVLLSGAERLGRPRTVVFVGTEGGKPQQFQGWGYAAELLETLIRSDPQYRRSLQRARAAGRQWDVVEPAPLDDSRREPEAHPWMQGNLVTENGVSAFDENGDRRDVFVEQALASELVVRIESTEDPREVTLVRLEERFGPVLRRENVDQSWSDERQIDAFFRSEDESIALTNRGRYESVVSRLTVLNGLVGSMVERANG